MEKEPIQYQPATRIASFKPYFFASLNQRITDLRTRKVDVIRLDMGSPDLAPAEFIVKALVDASHRADQHGYSPIGGSERFKKAVAIYYGNRFGVELDAPSEVLGLIGSKEGLFNLSQVMINPGDVALVPDPGYPVYSASTIIAGGEAYAMPLVEENHFLPNLDAIPEGVLKKAKILWLDYPNNPTGAVASLEFFKKAVDFARQHGLLIAHDAPYVDVSFEGYHPPSLLQIPGAKDVAIEFNSLSKTYNMAGWRIGMAVGNPQVISYLNTYKSQVDSSQYGPILAAAEAAMTGDQSWLVERNKIYQERRDAVVRAAQDAGLELVPPKAAIYVWVKIPAGEKSVDFCNRLLDETGVSTTPGVVYGQHGEGYMRISLVIPVERIREAMGRLTKWVKERH